MKTKKIPMRMCVVTRESHEKRELIRVVRNKEGEVFVDETGKLNGKGCYLKRDIDVIKKAKANKILDRALEIKIPETIYEELENLVK